MLDFSGYAPMITIDQLPGDLATSGVSQADVDRVCDDIRVACSWHIAPIATDDVLVVDSTGGALLTVPTLRMDAPSAVVDADDVELTDWAWSSIGQLERTCGRTWPSGFRSVKVTVTHGIPVPPVLLSVAEDMLRDRMAAKSTGSVASVSLDGAAVTYIGGDQAGVRRDVMAAYGHVLRRYAL